MIEYTGGNPAADQNPWSSLFKTIAILRIGSGVLLLTQHGWAAAWGTYQFLWEEKNWDWVKLFNDVGLPYPALLAPAVAIVVAAVALSWSIGFLTRLFSVLFIPILIGFLALAHKSGSDAVEAGWLYLLIAVTLTLFGSGAISIDKLFRLGSGAGRSRKKKRKGW
jgi:uncharacterized membrane protein YphA (DoxX/SURF4 family)